MVHSAIFFNVAPQVRVWHHANSIHVTTMTLYRLYFSTFNIKMGTQIPHHYSNSFTNHHIHVLDATFHFIYILGGQLFDTDNAGVRLKRPRWFMCSVGMHGFHRHACITSTLQDPRHFLGIWGEKCKYTHAMYASVL